MSRFPYAWLIALSWPACFDPDASTDEGEGTDGTVSSTEATFVTTSASASATANTTSGDPSSSSSGAATTSATGPDETTIATESPSESTDATSDPSSAEGSSSSGELAPVLMVRDDGPYLVAVGAELEVSDAEGVLANDEGEGLAVAAGELTSMYGGTVSIAEGGGFVYRPSTTLPFGTDRFSIDVEDVYGQTATAEVRIVLLPAEGLVDVTRLGPKGQRILGRESGSRFGASVSGAGDVNGDGFADVIVGVPYAFRGGERSGEAYLVYGDGDALSLGASTRIDGAEAGDTLGTAVSGVGDLDGDGLSDVAVGAPGDSSMTDAGGSAVLFLGADNLPTVIAASAAAVRFQGQAFDIAGDDLSGVGDLDGDGLPDLAIASTQASETLGEVAVIPGGGALGTSPREFLVNAAVRMVGVYALGRLGTSLDAVGDIDGDGFDELLIGSHATPMGPDTGETYIFFGRPDFFDVWAPTAEVSEALRIPGLDRGHLAGNSVSGAGDVNGDGWQDILIGAPNVSPGNRAQAGVAYLIFGGADFPTESTFDLATADVRFEGTVPSERLGRTVAGIGDFNGDGFGDLAFGSNPLLDYGTSAHVSIVLGGPDLGGTPVYDLADAPLKLATGTTDEQFGTSLEGAGDVNGDGFDDVIIGAWATTDDDQTPGAVYLVYGDDLGGTVTALGGATENDLEARRGRLGDVLIGGSEDDVLRGDGGPDVLRGGRGDDVLTVGDLSFFRVEGGAGDDTLVLPPGVADLTDLGAAISGIERLVLAPDEACELRLSTTTVRRLSDTTNTIEIDGSSEDHVILTGAWSGPTTAGDASLYTATATPTVRVRVTSEIDVTIE